MPKDFGSAQYVFKPVLKKKVAWSHRDSDNALLFDQKQNYSSVLKKKFLSKYQSLFVKI